MTNPLALADLFVMVIAAHTRDGGARARQQAISGLASAMVLNTHGCRW